MTTRIVFLSKGEDSPSTRYRAVDYFPLLASAGLDAVHVPVSGRMVDYMHALAAARQASTVVVLRKTFGPLFRNLLRRNARRLIFDFDDAIFCNSDGSPSRTRMKRFAAMLKLSDEVFAGNDFLAAIAAARNPRVTKIPTSIEVAKYCIQTGKPTQTIDLVWIGSSSTRKYLEAAMPALEDAARQTPGLRLKIIADFTLASEHLEVVPVRWRVDVEAAELASAHIGIAPMDDNDWTRGKCALKVLQYMAAGLPVISSNAGVNAEVVRQGVNGVLVSAPEDWVRAVSELASDPSLRSRMGEAGRELVRQHYSRGSVFDLMLKALEKPTAPSA